MYSRQSFDGFPSSDEPLHFKVSGRLWAGAMVMEDASSGSLFALRDGRGLRGPYEGLQLLHVASTVKPFGEWCSDHPSSEVLVGESPPGL